MAREVFLEAATRLHNGLALDGLDDHDAVIVWQSLPNDFPPLPGASRRAYVPDGMTHAQLDP